MHESCGKRTWLTFSAFALTWPQEPAASKEHSQLDDEHGAKDKGQDGGEAKADEVDAGADGGADGDSEKDTQQAAGGKRGRRQPAKIQQSKAKAAASKGEVGEDENEKAACGDDKEDQHKDQEDAEGEEDTGKRTRKRRGEKDAGEEAKEPSQKRKAASGSKASA